MIDESILARIVQLESQLRLIEINNSNIQRMSEKTDRIDNYLSQINTIQDKLDEYIEFFDENGDEIKDISSLSKNDKADKEFYKNVIKELLEILKNQR